MPYIPERGHAVWLAFDPQAGHEQSGRRPAIVISPLAYNRRIGLLLACPVTSQAKGYPFEVAIPTGLPISGVTLSDHIRSVDWRARQASFICQVPDSTVLEIAAKLSTLFPIPLPRGQA